MTYALAAYGIVLVAVVVYGAVLARERARLLREPGTPG
jgi:hypothetical protein